MPLATDPNHPTTTYSPNEWGVTLEADDAQISAVLAAWHVSETDDQLDAAEDVLDIIRKYTMSTLDSDDGDKIILGLFEFDLPLTVSLTDLVDDFLDQHLDDSTRKIASDDDDQAAVIKFAELLERLAIKVRHSLAPAGSIPTPLPGN